jgi:2-hydroxy-6-oxonona-2,4-dienedioate hydrolase
MTAQSDYRSSMTDLVDQKWVLVAGMGIRYATAGTGFPVVLLHGNEESHLDWSWIIPRLADNYRVYAPDLPGSGDSDKPIADYSGKFFARFLKGFLDELGLERVVLVGNSLGGLTALLLALEHPERVQALVLVDSAGLGAEVNPFLFPPSLPGVGEVISLLARTPLGAVQRAWVRSYLLFGSPWRAPFRWLAEQVRLTAIPYHLEAGLAAARSQHGPFGQRIVLLDELPRLIVPVLILWGALDHVFPARHARAAAERFRKGTAVVFPDCGHMPHVEDPEGVLTALGPFLTESAP